MKRTLLLLTLVCITVFACKRKNNNNNVVIPPGYVLNGVTDVTVERDSAVTMFIEVTQESGPQEPVTINVSGLPAGVTATVTPESGYPEFMAEIELRAAFSAAVGKYPVKLTVAGASGQKVYTLNLNIVPITECAMRLAGQYEAIGHCDTNANDTFNAFITPVFGKQNRVNMSGVVGGTSGNIFADIVDCNTRQFIIPKQNVMFFEITGSGTYDENAITLNYRLYSGFDTVDCITTLMRP